MYSRLVIVVFILAVAVVPAGGQEPEAWTLEAVVTIGGANASDEHYIFDQVTDAALTGRGNGNLVVLDVRGRRVLEYDEGGQWVRTWGRAGAGPGEFRFATAVTAGAGDSLWVFDTGRVTVFPADGGAVRTIPTSARTFGRARLGEGAIIRTFTPALMRVGATTQDATAGFAGQPVVHLGRIDMDGAVRDTIWAGPMPQRVDVTVESGNNVYFTHATEQFATMMHWDQLRDGSLVIADTSAYILRIISPAGRVLHTFGPHEPGRPVTAADRVRALEALQAEQEARADTRVPAELRRKQLEQTPFAAVMPRITGVRVDPDDRIWVGVSGATGAVERLDVYDRRGRLVAQVRSATGMPAAFYGNGMAAVLERDEYDAQRVRIMRVNKTNINPRGAPGADPSDPRAAPAEDWQVPPPSSAHRQQPQRSGCRARRSRRAAARAAVRRPAQARRPRRCREQRA